MRAALILLLCSTAFAFAPELQFIPVPQFIPIPKFAETPTAEASKEGGQVVYPLAPRADEPMYPGVSADTPGDSIQPPKILRYERRCGPNGCETVPVYEETPDEAAFKLRDLVRTPLALNPQMREAELERLSEIVDRDALRKAMRQEWSMGTCAMMCVAGGSKLYDVFPDGTVKLAAEQPATAPDEGVHGGGRGRVRIFGRRR